MTDLDELERIAKAEADTTHICRTTVLGPEYETTFSPPVVLALIAIARAAQLAAVRTRDSRDEIARAEAQNIFAALAALKEAT